MTATSPYQRRVLLILTLINFVNWIDRQIVYPLFPLIRRDFHVSYEQLGWLVAAFSLVYAAGSLGLGRLADATSRKKVIGYGILFWSCATFMSGLASSFRSLLTARGLVGVGEAAYEPAANAVITAAFAERVRARVQGIFNLGMFFGGALGLALGAILAEHVGWRPAFFVVGVPGLLLSVAILRLPETPRAPDRGPADWRSLRRPAYLLVLVSGWFTGFAGYAYVIWGVEFVYRYKGFTLGQAGSALGATGVVAGVLGVVTGAIVADRLASSIRGGRALAPAVGFLLSAPFILEAIHAESKLRFIILFGTGAFFMTWYHGPVTAVIHDLTPPPVHATAIGAYSFFVNLLATTAASVLIGKIADGYGLMTGMSCAVVAQVTGGLCFLAVAWMIFRQGPASGLGASPEAVQSWS